MLAGSANSTWKTPPGFASSCARRPFQRTYSVGSVRSRKTVSGGAWIVIVRSMTLVSTAMFAAPPPFFFLLGGGLQRAKAVVPEPLEIRAKLGDRLGLRAVEALGAVTALGHEPGLLHDPQVLRDRGPRDVEPARDIADGELRDRNEPQDLATPWLGERGERVHRAKRKP